MLEIRNLTKVYRPKRGVPVLALDHVSLRLPSHGMVFLLGKSGSGKSTLLNLLGGLDRADEGEILIRGVSSQGFGQQHFDSYRNTYVGFIFQEYNVLEEFTVGANIALAIELQGKKATDDQINAILHEVDLDGYGNRRPNELSGGQKQRVAIAGVLAMMPECIVLDEPTAMLDPVGRREVLEAIEKMRREKGMTVILITHHMDECINADRLLVMSGGKICHDGTPREVFSRVEEMKALGLAVPETTQLLYGLRHGGFELGLEALSVEECAAAIAEYLEKDKKQQCQ